MSSSVDAAALVGVWELVSWQLRAPEGGVVTEPFGPAPRGQLTYTDDGHMCVVITARERPALPADPAARTPADRAAAFDTVHAYAGRWRLDGDVVVHEVWTSTMPAYEGSVQRRALSLAGQLLTLTTPPGQFAHTAPGSGMVGVLTWRRARGAR